MNTTTRAVAGLTLAAAAVTVALSAPAGAMPVPAPSPSPAPATAPAYVSPAGHGVHRHWPSGAAGHAAHHASAAGSPTVASTRTTDGSGVDWARVGYGAIGGIAVTTAAGATLILVRRRQNLPYHG